MSLAKYSPTVSSAYQNNKKWWNENGGNAEKKDQHSWNDNDGFDAYGYDNNEVDRAGNTESDYINSYDVEYETYTLYDNVYNDWSYNEKGVPMLYSLVKQNEKKMKL